MALPCEAESFDTLTMQSVGVAPLFISPMNIGGRALAGFGFFNLLSILDVWVEEGRLTVAPLKFGHAYP